MGKRLDEALRIKPFIQKGAQSLSDAEALQIKAIYPKWDGAAAYEVEDKVLYGDLLYRCIQAHTAQVDWTPAVAASLWTVIDKAKLGYRMKAWEPQMNDQGRVELRNARHPLIDPKKVVPISLNLGMDFDSMTLRSAPPSRRSSNS